MNSTFAPLTPAELAQLRDELHREYKTAMWARAYPIMDDLTCLLHEVSRAEAGREPSRAVERHWSA